MSTIRRKPPITYKSPSGSEWNTLPGFNILLHETIRDTMPVAVAKTSSSTKSTASKADSGKTKKPDVIKRANSFNSSVLPLYHPLGNLALSLPPLDPASFGLSLPPLNVDDESGNRRFSARARRPVAKLRDLEENSVGMPLPTVSSIAAVAAREIKEKPITRKRRQAGGAKRKRKDVDDGDATYPAKRGRATRGVHRDAAPEEESPTEADGQEDGTNGGAASDSIENSKQQPERRTTRSRGALRRDSGTTSDSPSNENEPSNSPPTLAGPVDESSARPSANASSQARSEKEQVQESDKVEAEEKEEGELSEN